MSTSSRPYHLPDSQPTPSSFQSTSRMVDQQRGYNSEAYDSPGESSIEKPPQEYEFFHSKKFGICFAAMCLNVVLFGLDQLIITAAVPQIVSQFHALEKMEWLNTAFFIPCAGAILVYTQIMTVVDPRWTYIASIVIFEVGSVVCGAAPTMNALIVGRAIAGLGGAGVWNATYLIGGEMIPFEKRPTFFGLFGVSYILTSVMGPLVGGAFTDMSAEGWRWCFYINLPVGGVTLAFLAFVLPPIAKMPPFDGHPDHRPAWLKILRLDWVSAILTVGFVTCLGMGLQWGGVTREWDDAGVIVSLVFALLLFVSLIFWSIWIGGRAMLPMVLFKDKHFATGVWVPFFGYGSVVVCLYYLPLYFEAIKDKPATRAGVLLLALQLIMAPVLFLSGKFGEITGHAKNTIIVGSCLMIVASGIFTTLTKSTSIATVVGIEVIWGVGLGLVLNIMVILIQAKYLDQPQLVPHVTNVFNFWGFIGRIVAMSTATNIFNNKLRASLSTIGLPVALEAQVAAAPKAVWTAVPAELRDAVLDGYASSIVKVFWVTLSFSLACLFAASHMADINLKTAAEEAKQARESANAQEGYAMQASGASSQTAMKDEESMFRGTTDSSQTGYPEAMWRYNLDSDAGPVAGQLDM
ncbi:hypothetical protein IAT38_003664 [Cryptococcus sp. DSM 104549]